MNGKNVKYIILATSILWLTACDDDFNSKPETALNSALPKSTYQAAKTQNSRPEIGFPIQASSKYIVTSATGINTLDFSKRAENILIQQQQLLISCLLYTSPSPRDGLLSRMPSSA